MKPLEERNSQQKTEIAYTFSTVTFSVRFNAFH